MKKVLFIFFLLAQFTPLFAEYMNEIDSDSNLGTTGLIAVSVFLIAGIIALAWRKKNDID